MNHLLNDQRFQIASTTTDQNSSISRIMQTKFPQVKHHNDWWHYAKNWRKRLYKLAKRKKHEDLRDIIPSLYNYFCLCLKLGEGDFDKMRQLLQSMLYHISGRHHWQKDQNFSSITECRTSLEQMEM